MWKSNAETVTVTIKKPKIFAQDSANHVNKKTVKNRSEKKTINASVATIAKYSIPYIRICPIKPINQDLLLAYRLYENNLRKIIREQRLAIELEKKYKLMYVDLQKRIHIDDPPNDVRTVTDMDDRYFSYLRSHISTEYIPLYKSLKYLYGEQLRAKQDIGHREDCVLGIEVAYRRELEIYQISAKRYKEQVKQFEKFISEDYAKSMECLKTAETLYYSQLTEIHQQVRNMAVKQFFTQSTLLGIDNRYCILQKYGRFLYYLSPPSWRADHRDFARSVEIEARGFDLGVSSEEDTFNIVFEKLKNDCGSGLIKPVLYFTQPSGLMTIFETLEQQQLHHFIHLTRLQPVMENMKVMINNLKLWIRKDSHVVGNIIKHFENLIRFSEESAHQMEAKFLKILFSVFYDSVVGTDFLKLQANIEWCYERMLMQKPNTTIGLTAKTLEDMYMEYTYALDAIGNDEFRVALKQSIADEKNKMKRASKAAREMRLFDRLEKSLRRACDVDKTIETTVPRMMRRLPRKKKELETKPAAVNRKSSQRELTDEEIEYLHLFTDWNEKKNPAKYLQSYSLI